MKVLTHSTKVSLTRLGKIFAIWAKFLSIGQFFFLEKIARIFGRNFSQEKFAWATFWVIVL
jgi:hypothetical protein